MPLGPVALSDLNKLIILFVLRSVNSSVAWCTFQLQAQRIKEIHSKKVSYIFSKNVFLIFREMELFSPNLKNKKKIHFKKVSYIFSWKFLAARLKDFRMELSKLEKWKKYLWKKLFIFRETEISSPKPKKLIYIF